MRIKAWFSLFIISLFFSCEKDNQSNHTGQASAQFNNSSWNAKVITSKISSSENRFNMAMQMSNGQGILRQELVFLNIPRKVGPERIWSFDLMNPMDTAKVSCSLATIIDDGDVLCERYNVIASDSASNQIRIDQYDRSQSIVAGTFKLKMAIRLPKCNPTSPDTIYFTNGAFYSKFQ